MFRRELIYLRLFINRIISLARPFRAFSPCPFNRLILLRYFASNIVPSDRLGSHDSLPELLLDWVPARPY